MKYNTARSHRSNVRTFICSLLSYLLVTSQLAPLALAYGSPRPPKNSPSSSEVVRDSAAYSFAPVPAPLRVSSAPAPVAAALTATKTDSFADADGDGKAEPGEIITYSITVTNTGDQPANNVTLNDTVDPVNQNLTLIGGSVHSTPIGFADAYSVLGNVRIQVPDGANDLLANDTDPENAGNSNAGLTITTLAGDNSAPFSGTSANGGQVTATTGNGSFEYNPPPAFTGTDTFTYTTTDSTGGGTSTATVTLTITGLIWFINSAAAAGGDGRLTSPFNCYTGTTGGGQTCFSDTAADEVGDIIFLFSGNYTGGFTLLNNQRLVGQGATDTLANVGGVTVPTFSDALPLTGGGSPVVTTVLAGTNAVPLGQGNLLRGFTIGSTTGAKISGNTFGTLTVGNNASPDMILNGTGQALNLTNGTFAATSAFSSVTTTSSTAQGVFLSQVAGTVAFGSTTVSSSTLQGILVQQSTANVNFGNTVVGTGVAGTGGTNGVALLNNSGGTRTFGTLTIQNNNGPSNSAFLSATGGGGTGGGNSVAGTTNIPNVPGTGSGIDIQSLATGTSAQFGATTVNKASPGSLVNLVSNVGNVSFLSLGGTNTNGAGLTGTENTGSITVTNNTGSLTTTLGPAISITKAANPATPITLNFTALSSTNSGTQGINLDRVSGNLTTGTTNVNNSFLTGIQVQNTGAGTMNFGNTVSTLTGNGSNDANGTGVFLNANAGAVTFADLDISPDANERAFHATGNTGTISSSSGDIAATGNVSLEIVGPAGRTPLAMTLNNLDSTNSNGIGVNLTLVSGTFTVNDATQATNIQNPTGVGLQVLNNTAAFSFGNTVINGSGGIGASLGTAANGNTGNITFSDLDITPDANQTAFSAIDNTGTLTVATGDITTSGNRAVNIDGPAGRTPINIQFTAITTSGASNSISLVEISGTKFQVTGTTQINTRAGTGIFVDNSTAANIQFGTTNIPNVNNAGGYGIRVEDSSSPVTVASATINNPNVVTAQSDGDTNGIPDTDGDGDAIFITNNTGSFTLNGGTLSNCGNDCIDLRNSPAMVLSGVAISTPGIDIPLPVSTGAGFGGHGISAINLTGTSTVTNVTISSVNVGNRDGFYLVNTTSTALTLTVQTSTFQNFTGNRGFSIQGNAAANMTATVSSCTFQNISAVALQHTAGGSTGSTATVNMTVQNSTFQNAPLNGKNNLLAGVVEAGKANLTIQNNTFNNLFETASTGEAVLGIGQDGTLAGNSLSLNVTGNTINEIGSANSNCGGGGVTPCLGPLWAMIIFIDDQANVPGTLNIDNNTITNVRQGGINLDMANSGANASNVSAKITNNCIGRLRVAGACTGAESRIGQGTGLAAGRGISVERRRIGAKTANVLVSGNTIRTGVGQSAGALNTPGIFGRTHADTQMSLTVTNNSIDTNFVGAPDIRLDTNSPTAGDPATQIMCSDINGNSFPNAGPVIDINEIVGTHNVEQASAAAVQAANGGGATTVTADAGVSFGVVCATPPAITETGGGSSQPGKKNPKSSDATADSAVEQPATAEQTAAVADSITSRPFISSPRQEAVKQTASTQLIQPAPTSSSTGETLTTAEPLTQQQSKPNPKTPDTPSPNPPVVVGNNLTWNIGTLPAGQSVTITFQAQVEGPPYTGPAQVSNQGTVTADGGISVLTDDPSEVGPANPTVTPIDIPPDVTISDAKVAEPTSGTTSMLFTVALSTPATGTITVNYNTADGTATAPGDYTPPTPGSTVTFVAGEQLKMIPITVNSDADGSEGDETFTVTISVAPAQGNVVDANGTGTITAANTPGTLLISELRTSGPSGATDEFVEIYNNSNSAHVVAGTNGSTGYGVFKIGANCNATPVLIGTIPNGTNIPARGHFLLTGSTYSLFNYGGSNAALGNATLSSDIENDRNVAIYSTTNILALSTTTRFDAVGFGTNTGNICDLMREGTNLGAVNGSTLEYSFFRDECEVIPGVGCTDGLPKDTNDNAANFIFADPTATLIGGAGQRLGAPGPQNLASPIKRDSTIGVVLLDGTASQHSAPNRVFGPADPNPANNSALGTITIRRRVVNTTGASVTRLRFRVVEITTIPSPPGVADLRLRTSLMEASVGPVNDPATCAASGLTVPCMVPVQGVTLEQPPTQAMAGGFNSTVTLTLGTPLANNASVNVQLLMGVHTQGGSFRMFVMVEALP